MSDKEKLNVLSLLSRDEVYQVFKKRSDEIHGRSPDTRDDEISKLRAELAEAVEIMKNSAPHQGYGPRWAAFLEKHGGAK